MVATGTGGFAQGCQSSMPPPSKNTAARISNLVRMEVVTVASFGCADCRRFACPSTNQSRLASNIRAATPAAGDNAVDKKFFTWVQSSMLAVSLLCAAPGFAQEAGAPPESGAPAAGQGQGMGRGRGMMDPDAQLARMTQRYNLTTDQQTQIKPILTSTQSQMQALRGDSSLSREDRM